MFPQTGNGNIKLNVTPAVTLLAFMTIFAPCFGATPANQSQQNAPQMTFRHAVSFGVSAPLRELAKLPATRHSTLEEHEQVAPTFHLGRVLGPAKDPVEQNSSGPPTSVTPGLSIEASATPAVFTLPIPTPLLAIPKS